MRKMMHAISRICLIGIFLLSTLPYASGQNAPKDKGFTQQVTNELQQVLNHFANDPVHPYVGGMAAAIKVGDVAFWQGAAGYASHNIDPYLMPIEGGTPFTVNTPSQIYSVTKTFTAALVLELVREGKLALADPVSKYIDLQKEGIMNIRGDVTIHQLLAHESGYSDFWHEMGLLGIVITYPDKPWTALESLQYVTQVREPGVDRVYCSTDYIMLGAIVEKATGMTVAELFRERFFEPLGLNTMYLRGREAPVSDAVIAAPHDNLALYGVPYFPNTVTNISALSFDGIASLAFTSGGIVSTVADVARWGDALFNGKAVSKKTLDLMLNSIDPTPDKDGDYLGYGIWKSTRMSTTESFIGHDGSAPGYRSVMFYQPEKKLTIAILSNDYGVNLYDLAKALYAVVPNYLCTNGSRKDAKIELCYNGKVQCVDYDGAGSLTDKGAVLGNCGAGTDQQVQQAVVETGGLTHLRVSPNPVNSRALLSFQPEQSGPASLRLYDIHGKLVATLFEGVVEKGVLQQVTLERGSLPAGIYFSRLQTAGGISQQKVVLSR